MSRVASLFLCTLGVGLVGLDAACLNYVACYDDLLLDPDTFKVHHSNLEERSAVSCATTCLRRWPETQLVLAKLVDVSQLLECGCGDGLLSPANRSATVNDYYNCYVCPDADNQKCGSEKTSSVYQVDHTNHSCGRVYLTVPEEEEEVVDLTTPESSTFATTIPQLSSINATHNTTTNQSVASPAVTTGGSPPLLLLGCFPEHQVNESAVVTLFLHWRGVNVTHCAKNCTDTYPAADLFLVKLLNTHRLYCGCGSVAALGPSEATGHCHLYCHDDPRQPCGGWTSVSAYVRSAGSEGWRSCTSRTLLMGVLFLLLVW